MDRPSAPEINQPESAFSRDGDVKQEEEENQTSSVQSEAQEVPLPLLSSNNVILVPYGIDNAPCSSVNDSVTSDKENSDECTNPINNLVEELSQLGISKSTDLKEDQNISPAEINIENLVPSGSVENMEAEQSTISLEQPPALNDKILKSESDEKCHKNDDVQMFEDSSLNDNAANCSINQELPQAVTDNLEEPKQTVVESSHQQSANIAGSSNDHETKQENAVSSTDNHLPSNQEEKQSHDSGEPEGSNLAEEPKKGTAHQIEVECWSKLEHKSRDEHEKIELDSKLSIDHNINTQANTLALNQDAQANSETEIAPNQIEILCSNDSSMPGTLGTSDLLHRTESYCNELNQEGDQQMYSEMPTEQMETEEQPGPSHPEPYRLTKDCHSSEQEIEEAKVVATAEEDLRRASEAELMGANDNQPAQLLVSSSSSKPDPILPGEMLHHIKQIQFKDKNIGIVTQNENGPCPLVAIMNVLLLRWQISLPSTTEIISAAKLMEYIGDTMLESVPKNLSGEVRLNYEQNMHDAMAVLPRLQTGLDVNVKFTGVKDFEYTPECIIFDLLRIPLFHGWLVDPQDVDVAKAVGQAGYNQLVEKVISQKSSTNEDDVTEALVIENFLERTASQLTYHGITELNAAMNDGEIGVLFRNNHFSTLYKHQKELLQLVTDQGFLGEPNVVWETLSSIDGDEQFVDSQFRTVPPKQEAAIPGTSSSPNTSMTAEQQIDHDFLVALSLQEEQQQPAALEEETASESNRNVTVSDEERSIQEKADLELARQLQQEEERQAAEAVREASPSAAQQSQSQPASQGVRSPTQTSKKKDNCNIL